MKTTSFFLGWGEKRRRTRRPAPLPTPNPYRPAAVLLFLLVLSSAGAQAPPAFHFLSSREGFPFLAEYLFPPSLTGLETADSPDSVALLAEPGLPSEEPIEAPASSTEEVSSEKKAIVLEGLVLDQKTGEALDQIIVEVFLLDEQGEMRRAYAGNAYTGQLALPLVREAPHVLLLRKTGYQSNAVFLEGSNADLSRTFTLLPRHSGEEETLVSRSGADFSVSPLPAIALPETIASVQPTADIIVPYINPPAIEIAGEAPEAVLGLFQLTEATSFRREATHKSEVLLRFEPGDQVEVLEKTEYFWWRVRYRGQTGYTKALLLAPVKK